MMTRRGRSGRFVACSRFESVVRRVAGLHQWKTGNGQTALQTSPVALFSCRSGFFSEADDCDGPARDGNRFLGIIEPSV